MSGIIENIIFLLIGFVLGALALLRGAQKAVKEKDAKNKENQDPPENK